MGSRGNKFQSSGKLCKQQCQSTGTFKCFIWTPTFVFDIWWHVVGNDSFWEDIWNSRLQVNLGIKFFPLLKFLKRFSVSLSDCYDDTQMQYEWIEAHIREHDDTEFYLGKQVLRLESTSFMTQVPPSWLRKNALCLSPSVFSNFVPYVITYTNSYVSNKRISGVNFALSYVVKYTRSCNDVKFYNWGCNVCWFWTWNILNLSFLIVSVFRSRTSNILE